MIFYEMSLSDAEVYELDSVEVIMYILGLRKEK